MTAASTVEWERHADGAHISIPISPAEADEVRAWCGEHCRGFMIVLGRRVVFQFAEDAALTALWWRAEDG